MNDKYKDVNARIENVPDISREELLDAVFGAGEASDAKEPPPYIPRAEEWVDLADAGPFVDETTVPVFSPNGDGTGGEETYGDPAAVAKWVEGRLSQLPRVGTPSQDSVQS